MKVDPSIIPFIMLKSFIPLFLEEYENSFLIIVEIKIMKFENLPKPIA